MKKIAALILALLLLTAPLAASAAEGASSESRAFLSEYVQVAYDEDSSIPVSDINCILQTSDGYMWFAGYGGLMRYNGTETKIFGADDGLPSFNIIYLFEDSKNRLWVGTNDKGAALYNENEFTMFGIDEGLPSASVRNIAEDNNGNIYIATTFGVGIISPDNQLSVHSELEGSFAIDIIKLDDTRLLCLRNDGSMAVFDRYNVFEEFPAGHFGENATSVFRAENGDIYIGTSGQEIYITDADFSSVRTLTTSHLQNHADFLEDSEGRIWLAAENGIGYIKNNKFTGVDGLLMSSQIESIYEDYEGNFWVGSSRSGLLQLIRARFTNISFLAGLPDYVVNATAVWNGNLYIGTDIDEKIDSGLFIMKNYELVKTELTEMLNGVRVRSLFVDSKNQLWICTFGQYGGLLVENDGSITSFNEETGLPSSRVRCVYEMQNGDIVLGMTGGLSIIRDEKIIKTLTQADGLSNDFILSMTEDKDNNLLAGSDGGGIFVLDKDYNIINNYTEKDGLASGIILRVTNIGGDIWVSTGNAVCYMDDSGIRVIDKLELVNDSVYDIKHINDEIWFLHSKGVSICTKENLFSDNEPIITRLQRRDGLSSSITANSWNALSDSGILYISTASGVFAVDTRNLSHGEITPRAVISGIYADGEQVFPKNNTLTIGSNVQRVDIHISLLVFSTKDGSLSYTLEGFDSEVITAPRSDVAWVSYTNLPGGKYTFTLFGTSADGVQSDEVTLGFSKEYTILEMPFVQLLIILILVGGAFFGVRGFIINKTRTFEKQRQKYKEVAGQIMEVSAKLADMKEGRQHGHSARVAAYSKMVGERCGLTPSELETLYYAALLHDIGLVNIPEAVLNRRGKLSEEEYAAVKNHVTVGGDLLGDITVMGDIAVGARYHHERIDGMGYLGLKDKEIPLIARIICVCNAFDSMLSAQPFRKALPLEKAQSELIAGAGKQFDEKITAILISLINEGEVPLQ